MTDGMLRVAGVQTDTVWNSIDANLNNLGPWVARGAEQGAELVVLNETFPTGFLPQEAAPEEMDGKVMSWLAQTADREDTVIAGSVFLQRPDREYPTNTCVFMGKDGILGMYDKVRPFSIAGEDNRVQAGTEPVTVTINGVRVTPFICYDLRFPGMFWATALNTDLFIVPANWPSSRKDQWTALLMARAIETQAYVLGVNRFGSDGQRQKYAGGTCGFDPMGVSLISLGEQESLALIDVDSRRVERIRSQFPVRNDR